MPSSPEPPSPPVGTAAPAPVAVPPPSVDLEVHFDYKSAAITSQAVQVLTVLGRALSDERLAGQTFLIAGHTDAKGGADYNLELSQRRAESVRQFLIANFNVDAKKLIAKGYAFQHLRNPKDPLAAVNRRVQIVNLSKDQR